MIYNLTSNREDASDLTQESFIKAFQAISRFKGKSSFFTWMYQLRSTPMTFEKQNRRRYVSYEVMDTCVAQSEIVEHLAESSFSR